MSSLARFVLVGSFATWLQFALMFALVHWVDVRPVVASALGFAFSAFVNYQLNRVFTFASTKPHRIALTRFVIVATTGLCINAATMYFLVDVFGIYYIVAQVITTAMVLIWNYILNKRWTFSGSD